MRGPLRLRAGQLWSQTCIAYLSVFIIFLPYSIEPARIGDGDEEEETHPGPRPHVSA